MKTTVFALLILAGTALSTQVGCATHAAVTMPGPVADQDVRSGMPRGEVESLLGVGPTSHYEEEEVDVVRYEYSDGPPGGSKVRIVPYLAADVFTLFLSEIIFWPIEVYAKGRIKRVGTAHYDEQNVLVEWQVARPNGEALVLPDADAELLVAPVAEGEAVLDPAMDGESMALPATHESVEVPATQ